MNGGRRALDYRKAGSAGRFHRCSRCHAERELNMSALVDVQGAQLPPKEEPFTPIMVGNELLGFCCRECFSAVIKHCASVFPEANGFPLVDHHGRLVATPRCDDCGAALAYAGDGRSVLCPQCDSDALSLYLAEPPLA